jgi:hypothetical protein
VVRCHSRDRNTAPGGQATRQRTAADTPGGRFTRVVACRYLPLSDVEYRLDLDGSQGIRVSPLPYRQTATRRGAKVFLGRCASKPGGR